MLEQKTEILLTDAECVRYKEWLQEASSKAEKYNGSEKAEQDFFRPLAAMEAFVKAHNDGRPSEDLERRFAEQAWPENLPSLRIFNDFLQKAIDRYAAQLKNIQDAQAALELLKQGGGVVKYHSTPFVQTDKGHIEAPVSLNPSSLEFKTQPRLAMLIMHLKKDGIYTDDIVAHVCPPDPGMVRRLPYILLQIPRLDKEIAVCDEVGEVTFVSHKIFGPDFWANVSKEQLKRRPEISEVTFRNEDSWWNGIRQTLLQERSASQSPKVDVASFSRQKPPLDRELIKECILAHYEATGEWPTQNSREVRYGPYERKITWGHLHAYLYSGGRGLPGGSSLAKLNEDVSKEHGLNYVNHLKQEDLEISKIKECILAHYEATGKWPTQNSNEVRYGPYERKTTWKNLNSSLHKGGRGLPGGSSLAKLNEEVSKEHDLDYVNHLKQENLEISKIKECILVHHQATGEWPTGDSEEVRYGPYNGKTTWGKLEANLHSGGRGLPGGSSIAKLNEEVSKEHRLNYVNPLQQENLEISKIKECILAHHQATGEWPTQNSNEVRYGPYERKITWNNLNSNLRSGGRGLPGGSSLAKINEEASKEHDLDYVNHLKQEDLEIYKIKECILAHHQATGACPKQSSKEVRYGPYKGKITWGALEHNLTRGTRGLPGGSSLAKLNEEVSDEYGLGYVKGKHTARLISSRRLPEKNNHSVPG